MNRSGQLSLLFALFCPLWSNLCAQAPLGSRCSLAGFPANSSRVMSDEALLEIYNTQSTLVSTLESDALASASAGKRYRGAARQVATSLHFQSPGFLRITGFAPFLGSRAFDLASDGREFRLLLPVDRQMKLFAGPAQAAATSLDPKQNLRPQPIVDALHWPRGELDRSSPAPRNSRVSRTLSLLLAPVAGQPRTAKVKFDLARGTVSSLEIQSPGLGLGTAIHYADWEKADNLSAEAAACYPRQIAINQPKDALLLDLRIMHVALNAQIPPVRFLLNPPRGISVVSLSLSGAPNAP